MAGEPQRPAPRVNYVRRALFGAVCLAPAALLLASVGVGAVYPRQSGWGMGLTVAGLLVGGLNLYLAAFRPLLYAWRHGSAEGMRNVSGLPLVGTLLVTAGGAVGFCDGRVAAVGLVALACDCGGLPWFLIATWRDRSLWDA